MGKSYSIAEARQQLPRLVREAEERGSVQLTRRGKPVAMVLSQREYERRALHPGFWEALTAWRERHDVESLSIDPEEVFQGVRDQSAGREFTWRS